MTRLIAGAVALACLSLPAMGQTQMDHDGRYIAVPGVHHPQRHYRAHRRAHHRAYVRHVRHRNIARVPRSYDRGEIIAHPAGCPPVEFCGCGVARYIFGEIHGVFRSLWLARNWLKFPPAAPGPGMVAVHRGGHHVLAIIEYLGGNRALAYDPNSGGHRTRRHIVDLRAYSIRNPHG